MSREPPFMLDGARVVAYAELDASRASRFSSAVVAGVTLDPGQVAGLVIAENLVDGGLFMLHCNRDWETIAAAGYATEQDARESAEHAYAGVAIGWRAYRELTPEERQEVETTRAFLREIAEEFRDP
ncbi:MAG TPA: hypothetical protein VEC19_15455 [Usitatibacter sp.]|nr:hypothetical protein [Usitatibacter sp.]